MDKAKLKIYFLRIRSQKKQYCEPLSRKPIALSDQYFAFVRQYVSKYLQIFCLTQLLSKFILLISWYHHLIIRCREFNSSFSFPFCYFRTNLIHLVPMSSISKKGEIQDCGMYIRYVSLNQWGGCSTDFWRRLNKTRVSRHKRA